MRHGLAASGGCADAGGLARKRSRRERGQRARGRRLGYLPARKRVPARKAKRWAGFAHASLTSRRRSPFTYSKTGNASHHGMTDDAVDRAVRDALRAIPGTAAQSWALFSLPPCGGGPGWGVVPWGR